MGRLSLGEPHVDWDNRAYGPAPFKQAAHLSGLELMRKIATGEYPDPPICKQLTFRLIEVGEGYAVFEGETGPHLMNPMGGVHGGWALTLIDSATGVAAHTTLPPGRSTRPSKRKAISRVRSVPTPARYVAKHASFPPGAR